MGQRYLQWAHIGAFGRYINKDFGPFTPGLTVVYGKNEAGKTTLSSFIGGVLFGWEDARGSKNVYKPDAVQRNGSLMFCDAQTGDVVEVSRTRNSDGLVARPTGSFDAVGDIDKETFATIFSLDSDELRDLRKSADITSKLLTAGSGTGQSPSDVLGLIDARIASFGSKSASFPNSFPNLKAQADEWKNRYAAARAAADAHKEEDREYEQLEARAEDLLASLAETQRALEHLSECKGEVQRAIERLREFEEEEQLVAAEYRTLQAQRSSAGMQSGLCQAMSPQEEACARAKVSDLQKEHDALSREVSDARRAFEDARARFEAVRSDSACADHSARRQRGLRVAAVAACALLLACSAALLALGFMRGEGLLVGIGAALLLSLLCAGLLGSAAFQRNASNGPGSASQDAARQTMVERKRIYEAREGDMMLLEERIREALDEMGLAEAKGSLSAAELMLDAARENRLKQGVLEERFRSLMERRSKMDAERLFTVQRKASALEACGLSNGACEADIEAASVRLASSREAIQEELGVVKARLGQLRHILDKAADETDLDAVKIQRAQIVTRQQESAEELARLLIMRRILTQALTAWEGESQPEVYRRASEILKRMTGGAWTKVESDAQGKIFATNAVFQRFEPRLLSMGTCQQLYLALRIALLECVPNVGSSIPVLADDILVNFDDERRNGAAEALVELSKKRQVIVFTCHKEVVEAFTRYAGEGAVLAL